MVTHPSLTIYRTVLTDYINSDFEIELLDDACAFSEGPVWSREGYYLFSDIPMNIIYKISPEHPKQTYFSASGCTGLDTSFLSEQFGSNGLAYDNEGNLLVCQHGNGAIAKLSNKVLQPFITSYKGKRFNSPNDLVVHHEGTIFFTDPPYGLKEQRLVPHRFQPVAGLYAWRDGELILMEDALQYPNGVCLSPDQYVLYCCSTKPQEKTVLTYDTSTLKFIKVVATENSDGIKCDPYGNLYLCSNEGLLILNSEGERLGKIELSSVPANACWGGPDGTDLLVTARQNIVLLRGLLKHLQLQGRAFYSPLL